MADQMLPAELVLDPMLIIKFERTSAFLELEADGDYKQLALSLTRKRVAPMSIPLSGPLIPLCSPPIPQERARVEIDPIDGGNVDIQFEYQGKAYTAIVPQGILEPFLHFVEDESEPLNPSLRAAKARQLAQMLATL